ncbi:hypothetical protein ACQ4PT_054297 [Festuca glaucescens]
MEGEEAQGVQDDFNQEGAIVLAEVAQGVQAEFNQEGTMLVAQGVEAEFNQGAILQGEVAQGIQADQFNQGGGSQRRRQRKRGYPGKSFGSEIQVMDAKEERRKRDRERYARMTNEEKQEKLKQRREAYKQNKTIKEPKKQANIEAEQSTKKCKQKRQRYANMEPEQKKARIEQIIAKKELKRSTPCKESIAMVNPAYIPTEEEVRASTLNVLQRKSVTPGERQTLLHRRNEVFSAKKRKTVSVSSQEDASVMNSYNDGTEPPNQPQVMINDIPSSASPTNEDTDAVEQSFCNDDDHGKINFIYILMGHEIIYDQICCAGNNEVIFEHDTSDDEYIFSGQDWEKEVEIEIREDEDSNNPDSYDDVYRNIPQSTHMLKTEENCKFCGAKKFQYEAMGLCCKKGRIKLANPETPPELMRLWTTNDSDARYFQENIRFFNGHFSFTTLYCHLDRDTTDIRTAGIYTFRGHGQIYHNIHSFANSRSDPKHLELYFYDDDPSLEHRRDGTDRSMLTAYFETNNLNEEARGILYKDFPEHYTWQKTGKFWQKRKRKRLLQVGRIVAAHPAEGERYYLRVLLNNVTGATSYEDLKTVDGEVMQNFRQAAEKRGLIEADNTLDDCMTEAELFQMPSSLRRLFVTILVFCETNDVRGLWNNHLEAMSEDYSRNYKCKHTVQQMVLKNIRDMLQSMGKDIRSFPLPKIDEQHDTTDDIPREMTEESSIEVNPEDKSLHKNLNKEQRATYDEILATMDSQRGGIFFVDGPGGTGKTFLYRALLATVREQGKIALATATSGVAASIMSGGRTAHSRFKIPLRTNDGAICGFTKQSGTAKLLQAASLIIWDEASMTKRHAVEALYRSMRDIMDRPDLPFGGKTVVFGGDFRQVFPVVRKGTRAQIVDASLSRSELWKCMRQMKLVRNMRAQNDPGFAEYLLRIGNGTEETNENGEILLPTTICVPNKTDDNGLYRLIDDIYKTDGASLQDPTYITSRAILATRNDSVDRINIKMIERFQGEEMVYHSFDSVEEDPHGYYQQEFLNNLTPNGLPPHLLKLKINCPIILPRNIDPANGLCNGTRLVVRGFQKNAIDAEIVLGQHSGNRVFLPRIPLCPSDDDMFPFRFKRKQFPVRLSFAMTINKSQGQTIPNVGVYLHEPVFSHGQLYVALSRATAIANIKVLTGTTDEEEDKKKKANKKKDSKETNKIKRKKNDISTNETYTKNIVEKEVLNK